MGRETDQRRAALLLKLLQTPPSRAPRGRGVQPSLAGLALGAPAQESPSFLPRHLRRDLQAAGDDRVGVGGSYALFERSLGICERMEFLVR
jgi:hypothetical protein